MSETRTITVCDACESAACWDGDLMCDEACQAGTKEMPI